MAPIVTSLASIVKQFGIGALVSGGASGSFSATGGTTTTYVDGVTTYKSHTFTSLGTFSFDVENVPGSFSVDYLVDIG